MAILAISEFRGKARQVVADQGQREILSLILNF